MKCADCIHCDICKYRYRPLPLSDSTYDESDHIERIGCPFIEKSRFEELPGNVGLEEKSNIRLLGNQYDIGFNDIGIKFYLTREEAEKALERMEEE